ncbi:class I SAM-dependent methyltransferase [Quisquiliibacterium transsilvanicum]|jgi:2-polyprenyl-3-methyl-5-hydroxy-6-metoxy-1,4-benzoquinol methylase|uniref:2-polyprenyl-3-methyl-5-hydroxy-6-metoxy-1, 4-benzoquinol methylase n=1 Tax=Quisquiliibacterium transsilvanicum TaxID=1549638 RepID=A0A7W8HK77_9BURK|nr:class I SAM-dependent methyltransferase [Quisquiliibacterium transsilvanicum]MBB5273594.1 2-polyprenyl-3-methyl-5-hydroxy-6-metoxy-1,4-benzoquinol methylase [Quisquiliibacterium transsilvanicum]
MDKERAQRFMHKVIGDVATTLSGALVLVGDSTGLFRAMAGAGPLSADEVAQRSGVHPRYAQEWLGAMTCSGYVEHDPATDRFELPDEHAMYLTDPQSEAWLLGMFTGLPAMMAMAPRLADAFRSGGGVPFAEFGEALPVALEQMNRSVYESRLVRTWLPAVPAAVERLQAGGRAIDVGCGTGVVPLLLARAFPQASIEGLDLDARSIAIARSYAEREGLQDRVRFVNASAEALSGQPGYDLVTTFDVVHDLPDPLGVLQRIRGALAEGGTYLMVEPKVDDLLEKNRENPFGRMLFAISCLHCVPQSLAQGGPGLGACWGPTRARELAAEAGFSHFAVLPVRSPAMAFYELRA